MRWNRISAIRFRDFKGADVTAFIGPLAPKPAENLAVQPYGDEVAVGREGSGELLIGESRDVGKIDLAVGPALQTSKVRALQPS